MCECYLGMRKGRVYVYTCLGGNGSRKRRRRMVGEGVCGYKIRGRESRRKGEGQGE